MKSFAVYRLPMARQCTLIHAAADGLEVLTSWEEVGDTAGFVIAPFAIGVSTPIVVIRPRGEHTYATPYHIPAQLQTQLDRTARENASSEMPEPSLRHHYESDFRRFHARLTNGDFSKLVLARQSMVEARVESAVALFLQACSLYPRCFVALFSTAATGTWLVATPELLIGRDADQYRTMALAGTMEYSEGAEPNWSDKNVREQHYVASYIREAIEPLAQTISAEGPRTVRAGHLVHLRTDFRFTLASTHGIGEIIKALHPTPAICGLPKANALDFILENEHSARTYYSGFCGPVGLGGTTSLYVSLRCMQILKSQCCLYAGGGLLPDSAEAAEWDETEAKMLAMKRLL